MICENKQHQNIHIFRKNHLKSLTEQALKLSSQPFQVINEKKSILKTAEIVQILPKEEDRKYAQKSKDKNQIPNTDDTRVTKRNSFIGDAVYMRGSYEGDALGNGLQRRLKWQQMQVQKYGRKKDSQRNQQPDSSEKDMQQSSLRLVISPSKNRLVDTLSPFSAKDKKGTGMNVSQSMLHTSQSIQYIMTDSTIDKGSKQTQMNEMFIYDEQCISPDNRGREFKGQHFSSLFPYQQLQNITTPHKLSQPLNLPFHSLTSTSQITSLQSTLTMMQGLQSSQSFMKQSQTQATLPPNQGSIKQQKSLSSQDFLEKNPFKNACLLLEKDTPQMKSQGTLASTQQFNKNSEYDKSMIEVKTQDKNRNIESLERKHKRHQTQRHLSQKQNKQGRQTSLHNIKYEPAIQNSNNNNINLNQSMQEQQQQSKNKNSSSVQENQQINENSLYSKYMMKVEVRGWQKRKLEESKLNLLPASKLCLLSQVFQAKENGQIQEINAQDKNNMQTSKLQKQQGLRYPASQKDLSEFSKAQEQNELRFARIKEEEKPPIIIASKKSEQESRLIDAKIKERNENFQNQKQEQYRHSLQQEIQQSIILDKLVRSNNKSFSNNNNSNNKSLVILPKLEKSPSKINSPQKRGSSLKLGSYSTLSLDYHHKQKKEELEKELARETHLVDNLQQKKREVREFLQRFLESRPRFIKAISRNCLMDQEQFVFFVMSFFQFCVDDMFQKFKITNTFKLATLSSNSNVKDNQQITAHSISQIMDNDITSPEYKFSQKVPEEIMKVVLDVVHHSLSEKQKEIRIDDGFSSTNKKKKNNEFKFDKVLPDSESDKKGIFESTAIEQSQLPPQIQAPIDLKLEQQSQQQKQSSPIPQEISPFSPLKQQKLFKSCKLKPKPLLQLPPQQYIENDPTKLVTNASEDVCEIFWGDPKKINQIEMVKDSRLNSERCADSMNCFESNTFKKEWIKQGVNRFMDVMHQNVTLYILPSSIIDRIGGFVRLRQLIQTGIKTLNNFISTASKLNHIDESDENLLDKHLMPGICALINQDKDTLINQINIFQQHQQSPSFYDFYTIKKIIWDITSSIKLDYKIKFHIILQLENLRYIIFKHPFEHRIKELGVNMMKQYELCNYFRQVNSQDNILFLQHLFSVLYNNTSFQQFNQIYQSKLKFSFNDRFFDHLFKFLSDELKNNDSKSILDLQLRIMKLKIKAGVSFNFFSLIHSDSDVFFELLLPFLQGWVQKYALSNTLMDAKAMDFKFLEIFIKWGLNIQDLYSVSDTEPALMHFVINEQMLSFWLKGIVAYLEEKGIQKSQYKSLIQFLSLYLLFRKDPEEESTLIGGSPMKKQS